MLKLALDGMLSFSDKLLKLLSVLGIGMLAISGLGLLALLILLCCGVQAGAWWLAALMVLCTGTVTTGLGILGAYISRIYDETRARPLYIVGETRGFPGGFYTLPPINYHHGGSYGNQGNEHPRSTLA